MSDDNLYIRAAREAVQKAVDTKGAFALKGALAAIGNNTQAIGEVVKLLSEDAEKIAANAAVEGIRVADTALGGAAGLAAGLLSGSSHCALGKTAAAAAATTGVLAGITTASAATGPTMVIGAALGGPSAALALSSAAL